MKNRYFLPTVLIMLIGILTAIIQSEEILNRSKTSYSSISFDPGMLHRSNSPAALDEQVAPDFTFTPMDEQITPQKSNLFTGDSAFDILSIADPQLRALLSGAMQAGEKMQTEKKENTSANPEPVSKPIALYNGEERVFGYLPQRPAHHPGDEFFYLEVNEPLTSQTAVYLEYDLYGVEDNTQVSRSINDQPVFGGYVVKQQNSWSKQSELINPALLKQGINTIRFSIAENATYNYKIKNLRLRIPEPGTTDKDYSKAIVVKGKGSNELHIEGDELEETGRRLIVNQPTTAYYYRRFGYVQGFVTGQDYDKALIRIGGQKARAYRGEFESLVSRNSQGQEEATDDDVLPSHAPWNTTIEAVFPDGEILKVDITFEKPAVWDHLTGFDANIHYAEEEVTENESFELALATAALQGEAGSLQKNTTLSITALRAIDLPRLNPGMVNVTADYDGYRFLPHGSNFEKPLNITLGYDSTKLPRGHYPQEIRTYYYDESRTHWVALPRDSVNRGEYLVCSRSTHFTDMINAIVKAPEMPETQEYTPTSLKELQAADPSSGIQMMQPPTANSQGTASLSYPINVPAGRQGLQPNLAVTYSSEAANGLLGMGWDMQIPAITVDTKWGVPRYDSLKETETYLYNGEELLPSPRIDGFETSRYASGKQFHPRVEGGFEKIVRKGNRPYNYCWVVTDKQGTQYYYGTYTGNECDTSVLLKDKGGNIAQWPLCKVIDINSNCMQYCYKIRNQVYGGITLGQQLWLESITYTGHDNTHGEGSYKVVFGSEANMTPEQMQSLGCTSSGSGSGTSSSNSPTGNIPLSAKMNKNSTASTAPASKVPADSEAPTGSKGPECNVIIRKTDRNERVLDNVQFDLSNGIQLATDYIGNTPSFVMHEGECFEIKETDAPRCCALLDHTVTICVKDNCNIDVQPPYPVHQETVNGEVVHVVTIINTCDCSDYNYHTPTVVRKVDQKGRVLEGVVFKLEDGTEFMTDSDGNTSPFFIPPGGSMRIDEVRSLDCCEPLPYPIHITDDGNGNFDVEYGFPVHQETVNGMVTNVITIENECNCTHTGYSCQTIIRKVDKGGRTIQGVEFRLDDGRMLTTDETGSTQAFGIREGDHITIHEIQTLECCYPLYLPIEIEGHEDCNIKVHPHFSDYTVYQEWRDGVLFNIITVENDCHCPDEDTRLKRCQIILRKVDQDGNMLENVVFKTDNNKQLRTNKDGYTSRLEIQDGQRITIHEVSTPDNCYPLQLPIEIIKHPDCKIEAPGFEIKEEIVYGMQTYVIYIPNYCTPPPPTHPCKLRIKKVNANGNGLQGGVFRSSTGQTWTSDAQGYTSNINLTPGTTITLTETQAPSGYQLNSQTIRIEVFANCSIRVTPAMSCQIEQVGGEQCWVLKVTNTPVPPPSNPCKLRIKKTDANGNVLQGAVFRSADGSTFTSGTNGYTSGMDLQPGTTITLTETQAPSGYQPGSQTIQIEVLANCSIRVTPTTAYQIEQVGNERYWVLKIKNDTLPPPSDPCKLRIKKVDKNGNPLQGAVFETADGLVCSTDAGGFTSDIPLEPGKTIELVETQAPDGFKRSTRITRVEVFENCSIRVTPAMDYRVEQQGNEQFYVMTIVNKPTDSTTTSKVDTSDCTNCKFRIRKVNKEEEGLAGAVFQIEGGGTLTTGSEGYSSYFPLNNKISFHETTPPAGYKLNTTAINLRADEHCNATISAFLDATLEKDDDCHWTVTIKNENEKNSYYYIHKRDKHTGTPIENAGFGDGTGSAFTDSIGNTRKFPLIPGQSFRIEEFHVPLYYDQKAQAFADVNVTQNGAIEVNGSSQLENLYQDSNGDWVFVFSNVNLRPPGRDTIIHLVKTCDSLRNLCPCYQIYQPDLTINARYGFRQSSKDKLTKIVVFYGEDCVRSYDFCYTTDYFGRTQLQAVTQWSSLDTAGGKHINFMEYFEGPELAAAFSQPVELVTAEHYGTVLDNIPGIPKKLKNKFGSTGFKPSLVGGSRTWSFGINGGADIGLFPVFPLKTLSAGLYFSTGAAFSKGRSTLMDINGDGLPDQVYSKGKVVYYRLQIPDGNRFGDEQQLEGMENFLQDKSTNFSFGFQASAGVHGGYQKGFGSSETKVYFADINGDGFPDLVHPNGVKYIGNHQRPPVYTLPECLPPVIRIDTTQLTVVCDTMPYIQPYTETTPVGAPQYDFVRVWVADLPDHPNLRYKIGGKIYFADSVDNETDMDNFYGKEDSLVLSIQWRKYNGTKWIDTLLWIDTIGRMDMINMGKRGWNNTPSSQSMAVMGATGSNPATGGVPSSSSMPLSMPVIPPGPVDTTASYVGTSWPIHTPDYVPLDGIGTTLLDNLPVRRGDTLYFRVHALHNGVNRALVWDPSVKSNIASLNPWMEENDENGKMFGGGNSAAQSQLLQSDSNFFCPFNGKINISYTYENLAPLLDTVYYEIFHNNSRINHFMIPPGGYYAVYYDYASHYGRELPVAIGDTLSFKVSCGSNVNHTKAQWNPKITYMIALDTNRRDTLLYRPQGDILEYEIAPSYQYYHKILHLDYNNYIYSLPETTPVSVSKIKVLKESTSPFYDLRVPARFTVTQPGNGNKHLYAETVTMGFTGGFKQLIVPANSFTLEAGLPFYVSCFVPGEWAWCIRDSCYITINGTDYKCAVYTQEDNNTLWGGMYGRWGQFQYMSDDLPLMDKSKIFMSAAYRLGLSSEQEDVDFYAGVPTIANSLTDLESAVKNGYDKIYIRNFKSRLSALPMHNRIELTPGKGIREHQGYYPNSFIHKEYVYIGGLPVFDNIEDPDEPDCDSVAYPVAGGNNGNTGTGSSGGSTTGNAQGGSGNSTVTTVKGYSKFSTSTTDSYSFGVSIPGLGLGTSKAETQTKQLSDMMDLNGDGFPDIIRSGNVQYSKPFTGQWETSRHVFDEGCHHYTTTLNITKSFTADPQGAIRAAKNSGKGKTALTKTPKNSKGYVPDISATASKSKTYAEDITHYTLMDVNGDGLPDRVYHMGKKVALNIGYGFEDRESWDLNGSIGSSISNAGASSFNLGFSGGKSGANYSFSAGLGGSQSYSQHQEIFVDMNNDGLPDRIIFVKENEIHIMFSAGIGKTDSRFWVIKFVATDRPDLCKTSVTKSISGTVCITLGFPIVWWAKVSASAGAEGAFSINSENLSFIDMNGDGYADIVFRPDPSENEDNKLYVMYSQLGKTGLLKKVTNPLGGTIEMDYALTDANVMHSRRQVLSEVKIKSNHANDPGDVMLTSYTYESGYYDRKERVFYGFAKVTEKQHDTRNSNTVLRMVTKYYHNANPYNKGLNLGEILTDGTGKRYILTRNKWTMRDPGNNMLVLTPTTGRAYPALDTTVTCYYEGQATAQIRKEETYRYDTYGRPVFQTSTSTSMPVVAVSIKYDHPQPGNYNISIPSEVIVHPPGQPQQFYRKRTTGINTSTGRLDTVHDYYTASSYLTTSMQYDPYGNCTKIQYPNHSVTVGYENILHTYPEYVTNDFNETSWMAEYDYRFGIPLVTRDIHGYEMNYSLDEWGRIATILSPKELGGRPYTVKYEYFGSYCPYNASLNTPYKAKTSHFDVQHPDNDIETYTFCDGLGRIVQTKVDASINGQEQMIVSGKVTYDALGRVKETYLPGVCSPGDFVFAPDGYVPAATSTYDVLDRPLLQIAHDGTSVQYKYGFGNDIYRGNTLFKIEITDQNYNISTSLANVNQQQYEVQPAGHEPVWFEYNPMGELQAVRGHDFERSYQYDKLGRKTDYLEGVLYEHYTYQGENLIEKRMEWDISYSGQHHEAFLYYDYQHTRLERITQSRSDYSYSIFNVYLYDIGSRPTFILDESGIQLFEYGKMGEVTKQTRIFSPPGMDPFAVETRFEYDSWGRTLKMTYPDGEIVTYGYDYGGQLITVHGDKGGQSYSYLEEITYNEYGAKTAQTYGNQSITFWQYNPYNQRLEYQQIRDNYGQDYLTTVYSYDNIGNITEMQNNHYMGNYMFTRHQFGYNAANQLVRAIETDTYLYDLTIEYGGYGKMNNYMLYCQDPVNAVNQARHSNYQYWHQSNNFAADYSDEYTYYNGVQYSSPVDYSYGINGSLRSKSLHHDETGEPRDEFYLFDAYGNMNAYCDNKEKYAYYSYDDAGQRTYKMTFDAGYIANNHYGYPRLEIEKMAFYPNGFMNINQYGEYTKHYYAGDQRIASKIGTGSVFDSNLCEGLYSRYEMFSPEVFENLRYMAEDKIQRDLTFVVIPEAGVSIDFGENTICNLQGDESYEYNLFFYHGNHLSSTQMITDINGDVIQQVQYAPFGEIVSEYNAYWHSDLIPNYTFNAKELDEETGMYYFEARYLKPPSFISRDPLFEKYPWISPYVYCANNPVKYVDPTGEDWWVPEGETKPVWSENVSENNFPEGGRYIGTTAGWTDDDGTHTGDAQGNLTTMDLNVEIKAQRISDHERTMNLPGVKSVHKGQNAFLRGTIEFAADVSNVGGCALTTAGTAALAIPALQGVGGALITGGSALSLVGSGINMGLNLADGNYGQAAVNAIGAAASVGATALWKNVGLTPNQTKFMIGKSDFKISIGTSLINKGIEKKQQKK